MGDLRRTYSGSQTQTMVGLSSERTTPRKVCDSGRTEGMKIGH